jgi:prepilin-type N-terminal cleavage/methylation domain-containing protein
MARQKFKNKSKGLTLIEMVMAITIVGIITGITALYARDVINLWNFLSFRNEIVSGGRIALMRMVREIRQIKNTTAILAAEGSRFRFIDVGDNTIEFTLNATDLFRNTNVLVGNVRNLTFRYFNLTSQQFTVPVDSANLSEIRRIAVSLDMGSNNQNRTIETQICPRNL